MHTIYVDGDILVDRCTKMMDGHISYSLGAKVALDSDPATITQIDCSGFIAYILYQTSFVKLHGGSWMQSDWMNKQGFANVKYDDVGALKDNVLRVGYFPKSGGMVAGHIWFVLNGATLESYSGGTKHGPGRRTWDTTVLKSHVKSCYEIGHLKRYEGTTGTFPQCRVIDMSVSESWE